MRLHEDKYITLHDLNEVLSNAPRCNPEVSEMALWDAVGLVLANDIIAPFDTPIMPKAVYDGFAVKAGETPGVFKLVGSILIGQLPNRELRVGETYYVTTGAYLPKGADVVVPEEDATVNGDSVIINKAYSTGDNIDEPGSYAKKGQLLVSKGTVLTPYILSALLETGVFKAQFYNRLKVTIISTGSELVKPRTPEGALNEFMTGKVIESTGLLIEWFMSNYMPYVTVLKHIIINDSYDEILSSVTDGLRKSNIIVITGGTRPSGIDYVHDTLTALKPKYYVRGIKMRPGRPSTVAVFDDCHVAFGVSGHPISALNALSLLIEPFVRNMLSIVSTVPLPKAYGRLLESTEPGRGLWRQVRAKVEVDNNGYIVKPLKITGSSFTSTLAEADALINIPPWVNDAAKDLIVEMLMLRSRSFKY
ncbi:molybdopterin molybdotransferase MoeA [Caldivirga maquilingensis]|uniref:MoeA domain protein domain I and II n=1 Tax=Caldivirga maquilingensis (strain ATCC 700844 / DSM 13496 / JCM 10307 / IC-167) TaxID=397948 RepID=A8MCQ7_CALMQ|nr:molybdopterin molybdotransferase MoeA [Caldivirga maquilingensis]ABW01563.1 MoeA domain protein domain I and II [Caldivirga maquilingensis IC-167]